MAKQSKRSLLWLGLFAGARALAAKLESSAARKRKGLWYRLRSKPRGQPPAWVLAPAWAAVYGLMSLSAYRVARLAPSRERSRALRLWWTQVGLNAAWSPLFRGGRRSRVALPDLVAMTAATADYTRTVARLDRPAALMMTPVLGWLGYTGYLDNADVLRRRNLRLA